MNTATQIIEAFKHLPAEEQAQVTNFIESQNSAVFKLTEAEAAEIQRRLDANEETVPAAEVFAKFGL